MELNSQSVERVHETMQYERSRSTPPEDFPNLPDIPGRRYVDPEFLALERERMWQRAWLYAGHTDQLPNPGSWFLTRNTGAPVIVVRDLEGTVRAFYNTCQHRGAPLVNTESGDARGFVCGYHGWSYTLEGKLTAVRDKRDFVDLDFSCRSLVAVRCELLGSLIFINEDPDAQPLNEHIGPMAKELAQYDLENLRLVDSRSYEVQCNVKVLLDAFLEVYHLKSIHQHTVDRFLDHRGMFVTLWPNGHSRMLTPNRRPDWKDPGTIGMPKIPTITEVPADNNVSYHVYPNFVMPASDSGIPLLQFWPTSDKTCRVVSSWIAPDYDASKDNPLWDTRIANWERILYEDLQFAPQIQESLESKGFRGMPLNYQERRIYHWHEELDRRIGLNQVPPEARVEQVLHDFVDSGEG
ncbi:aromatic ring-hydroxylating oxygenase subunit alpha [Sphingosinicella soli]|uniref:Phenylpropionate dioxygenase-like ring-hydroxylating dioxygenase large terminal subunit n=1 Tax=Sphingosinicella soli TaxID=333708 RepID=A0A7W7B1R3_9SPHN|nr:aromatic ring-hydroxylating dioxygenase subunit alpha [Sphingosinicella soli]MBB4632397.1 phenylpropionate dioxygenase-like ring-hydroxylating dioxygenase large terminal subunit [Sphingosinicella soli]